MTVMHDVLVWIHNGITGQTGDNLPSDAGMLTFVVVGTIGIAIIIRELKKKPRVDPTLHMPDPPTIEHQPQRGLPPGKAYVEWTAEEDKKKDHSPWDR
jgi:hypothetical protein